MKIMFDDGRTKYEIKIESNTESRKPHLYVTVIVDNGQEVFEGRLPRTEPK